MKKLLGIVVLVLFWCNSVLAVSLPKDVVSGSKFTKSLTGSYYKKYGMQVVDKKDGHPVRAGEKSIRFEVRAGDCGKDGVNMMLPSSLLIFMLSQIAVT